MNISFEVLKLYRLDNRTLAAIYYIATTTERDWSAEERLERIRAELNRHGAEESEIEGHRAEEAMA